MGLQHPNQMDGWTTQKKAQKTTQWMSAQQRREKVRHCCLKIEMSYSCRASPVDESTPVALRLLGRRQAHTQLVVKQHGKQSRMNRLSPCPFLVLLQRRGHQNSFSLSFSFGNSWAAKNWRRKKNKEKKEGRKIRKVGKCRQKMWTVFRLVSLPRRITALDQILSVLSLWWFSPHSALKIHHWERDEDGEQREGSNENSKPFGSCWRTHLYIRGEKNAIVCFILCSWNQGFSCKFSTNILKHTLQHSRRFRS